MAVRRSRWSAAWLAISHFRGGNFLVVASSWSNLQSAFFAAKLHVDPRALSAQAIILSGAFDLVVILGLTGVVALMERRRIDSYGLPAGEAFGRFFWNGALTGPRGNRFCRSRNAQHWRNAPPRDRVAWQRSHHMPAFVARRDVARRCH
jgi:hypothetical protein